MGRFEAWLSKWRRNKGVADATPVQELQLSMIASGDWLLVVGEKLVKVALKPKPRAADVQEIAAGLHAAAHLIETAAVRYELATRGLKL